MVLDTALIGCFIFGGIVAVDTEAAWLLMVSQPLVACTVAGIILGNPGAGLTVGLLLQLPYLAEVPVGGARVSFSSLSTFVAAILFVRVSQAHPGAHNLALFGSLVFGIVLSAVCVPARTVLRQVNLLFVRQAEKSLAPGRVERLTFYTVAGVLSAFVFGCLFSMLFFVVGRAGLDAAISGIGTRLEAALAFTQPVLLGAGIAVVVRLFVRKKTVGTAVVGAIAGALILYLKP